MEAFTACKIYGPMQADMLKKALENLLESSLESPLGRVLESPLGGPLESPLERVLQGEKLFPQEALGGSSELGGIQSSVLGSVLRSVLESVCCMQRYV